MNDADDFLERHGDAIENAMLKKRVEELEGRTKLMKIRLPHSGEWVRTVGADGKVTLSYPPGYGYDDAKDEVERMLDEDRWKFSLWEASQHRKTRWLFLWCLSLFVIGFAVIQSTWQRTIIATGSIVVLHSYLRLYGNGIKNPIARLRSYLRGRL